MTHCDYEDSEWEKDDASWEFRYPDGYKKLDNSSDKNTFISPFSGR
jgi:hypothetical protein